MNNTLDIVQFLVKQGADINAKNAMGETPLDLAEKENVKKILKSQKNKKWEKLEAN